MDIQSVINLSPGGTTFCLKAGSYPLSAGVLVKSYDVVIGEPGTVLDGRGIVSQGVYGYGGSTGQHDVTVRGLSFQNFTTEAVHAGWNWLIEDNEMRTSRVGVAINDGTVLRNNYIHHNAQYGIKGGPTKNVLIDSNEVSYNNTLNSCGGSCEADAGGSKIVGSTPGTWGVTWRGNWVHDNTGPGIWSDGNVHNVLYEGNTAERNSGPGIFHEISWDAVIRSNTVRNNDTEAAGKSCYWGSQIHVNNSQNVEIYGNTVGSQAGGNGICLVDAARSDSAPFPTYLGNVSVHDNTIQLSSNAESGLVGGAARSITFDRNAYRVVNTSSLYWAWYDKYPLTWSDFHARGQEPAGTVVIGS
jgi:parallel beta-helix repeat protein